jgi:hypothetical protein
MNLIKVFSTEKNKIGQRLVKILRFGKSDVQTPFQASPFGIDSNPVKDMIAVYSETTERGKNVIVGYLNKDMLAEAGETRFFSTDSEGVLKSYAWLKNDGTIEFCGNDHNLIRYSPLNQALQQQVVAINSEITKIAVAISALGGTYIPDTVEIDISESRINELKTI